jgi:hypothetical protein
MHLPARPEQIELTKQAQSSREVSAVANAPKVMDLQSGCMSTVGTGLLLRFVANVMAASTARTSVIYIFY